MSDVKMFLVDVINCEVKKVTTNGLDDYYRYLNCDCIDIVRRRIGDTYFEFIVDDEGLFKNNPIPSAISPHNETMFVGNLLIASGTVIEGELTDITDEEVKIIKNNLKLRLDFERAELSPVLSNVEY